MKILDLILDIIYPKRCVVCGALLGINNSVNLCSTCNKIVKTTKGIKVKDLSVKTTKSLDKIDSLYSIFEYKQAKNGIQHFKFDGCKNNGILLGDIMFIVTARENFGVFANKDILIPVPIHDKKYRQRGFNQAEILAERISLRGDIPVSSDNLVRVLNTTPQSEFDKQARKDNVKNAFVVKNKEMIEGKRILLVDDIDTTGATINECARALLQAGAKKVSGITLTSD